MPESITHIELVETLQAWCRRQGNIDRYLEFIDHPRAGPNANPEIINGFKPDYCLRSLDGEYAYIGEAKTSGDIKNNHTLNQLIVFGQQIIDQGNGSVVIAVPQNSKPELFSLLTLVSNRLRSCVDLFTVLSQEDIIEHAN